MYIYQKISVIFFCILDYRSKHFCKYKTSKKHLLISYPLRCFNSDEFLYDNRLKMFYDLIMTDFTIHTTYRDFFLW